MDKTITRQVVVGLGLVVNDDNEILLTQRYQPELPNAHNRWEIPGGRVELAEHPAETARRELKEETGFDVRINKNHCAVRDYIWSFPDGNSHTILICYTGRVVGGERVVAGGKIQDVRWWKLEDLPRDNFLPNGLDLIQELLIDRPSSNLEVNQKSPTKEAVYGFE